MSVVATGGMVAAVQQAAAEAGAEMLRKGGNAVDAAVATVFAQGVVDPYRCGIGGGGMALVRDGKTGEMTVLKFYGYAPKASRPDMFTPQGHWGTLFMVEDNANLYGYRASVVPGLSRGLDDLLRGFGSGRISWREAIEPAQRLATDGFAVFPFYLKALQQVSDHPFIGASYKAITWGDPARAVFLKDGKLPRLGEVFRQPDYGRTLQRMAEQGVEEFYQGETAAAIIADFSANGGLLSAEDLTAYKTTYAKPIHGSYRGLDLWTEGAPSIGPTFLQLMHIMDGWDVRDLGFNTVDYLDRMIRAANCVFQDRLAYIGDEDYVDVPLAMLLSAERAAEHRATIEQQVTSQMSATSTGIGPGSRDTTHVTVIDEDGTIALITHSIGSGSGVVTPGLGFLHNNHMIQFDPRPGNPNSIAPQKHPNVGGGPVLALQGEELLLAMGSPAGGAKATAMAQAIAAIVDFGKPAADAAFLDRFHAEDVPGEVTLDTRFEPRAATALGQRGYNVNLSEYGARIAGIYRDPATGDLVGMVDPRGDRGLAQVASGRSPR